jgi:hypothetical protein
MKSSRESVGQHVCESSEAARLTQGNQDSPETTDGQDGPCPMSVISRNILAGLKLSRRGDLLCSFVCDLSSESP